MSGDNYSPATVDGSRERGGYGWGADYESFILTKYRMGCTAKKRWCFAHGRGGPHTEGGIPPVVTKPLASKKWAGPNPKKKPKLNL